MVLLVDKEDKKEEDEQEDEKTKKSFFFPLELLGRLSDSLSAAAVA
jgi:hypothetical protein